MLHINVLMALLSSASLAAGLAFPGGDGDGHGDGHGEYHGDKGKTCSAVYSTKYIPGETKSQYYETKTNEYPYLTEVTTAYTTSSAYPYPTTIYNTTWYIGSFIAAWLTFGTNHISECIPHSAKL